jgi:hypothetical protein
MFLHQLSLAEAFFLFDSECGACQRATNCNYQCVIVFDSGRAQLVQLCISQEEEKVAVSINVITLLITKQHYKQPNNYREVT